MSNCKTAPTLRAPDRPRRIAEGRFAKAAVRNPSGWTGSWSRSLDGEKRRASLPKVREKWGTRPNHNRHYLHIRYLPCTADVQYACHIGAHHSVDSDPRSVGCGSMESWWRRRFNTKRRRLLTAYGLFSYCSSNAVENAACIRGISTGGTYFEK